MNKSTPSIWNYSNDSVRINKKTNINEEALRWVNNNKEKTCNDKSYYSSLRLSSEYPDCSMPITFDQYNFCQFGCLYCFAYMFKSNNPSVTNSASGLTLKSVNPKKIIDTFKGKYQDNPTYKHFIKNRKVIQWGSMAEPFDGFEHKNGVGFKIMEHLMEDKYPIRLSTKAPIPDNFYELFKKYKENKNIAFMYSIITTDEEVARNIEIGVISPEERFKQLYRMKELGYYTIARLRPFIIGITDKKLDEYLEWVKKYEVDAISMEFFAMDARTNEGIEKRYNWISDVVGFNIYNYYKKLSPTNRGTYMRLNRDIKEPFVRKIYKFCVENNVHFGISDPDFKELNMSGSCCSLPRIERNKWHKDLSNFSTNQLTELLRNKRKEFWINNNLQDVINNKIKNVYLTFDELVEYKDESTHWLKQEKSYVSEMIEKMGKCSGAASQLIPLTSLRHKWNNLSSPGNPINYFNGKVIPFKYDENKNIIYKYNVMPYEIIWQRDYNIDLSKN